MDIDLINAMIKVVKDDIELKNNYKNFNLLLLELNDEEINYFLIGCDKELFANVNLSLILICTIPQQLKKYIENFVNERLNIVNILEFQIKQKFSENIITEIEYEKFIKEYNNIRDQAFYFKMLYFTEIDKELKKRTI